MTHMKNDDALAIAYNYIANMNPRGFSPSPTERMAIEIVERNANEALRQLNPLPKHWTREAAEKLVGPEHALKPCTMQEAIRALVDAEEKGFNKAIGACNNYIKDIHSSRDLNPAYIACVDACISRINAAARKEKDDAYACGT